MANAKLTCQHCGTEIQADENGSIYSVSVDNKGYLTDIIKGVVIPEAYLYCTEKCMFLREHGVVPMKMDSIHFMDNHRFSIQSQF
jgi:hypothetical protein